MKVKLSIVSKITVVNCSMLLHLFTKDKMCLVTTWLAGNLVEVKLLVFFQCWIVYLPLKNKDDNDLIMLNILKVKFKSHTFYTEYCDVQQCDWLPTTNNRWTAS